MKITLVRPSMRGRRTSDAMQPLAFAILRALTPPDVEVVAYDERIEPIPLDEPTDLVAMTVETYTARRAFQLSTAYRRRGVPVVMGGYHPTFLPDECGAFADAIALGDAEGVWPTIGADARLGRLRPRYQQRDYPALRNQPLPDRSVFAGKKDSPVTLVQYLKYNPLYSRETFKKQGMRLGYYEDSIHPLRPGPLSAVCEELVSGALR